MAARQDDNTFYKCQCGIYFATMAALSSNKCKTTEDSNFALVSDDHFDDESNTLFKCESCSGYYQDRKLFIDHDCVRNSAANQPATGRSMDSCSTKHTSCASWGTAETKLLIELYKTQEKSVSKGKMRKKNMWDKISSELSTYDYTFTPEQVSGRWKSLTRAYKGVKDNNKKSGMGRKTYEFENELDEIFENDPTLTPEFVMSSSQTSEKRKMSNEGAENSDSSSNASSSNPPSAKKTRSTNTNKEIVDVFKSFVGDQKDDWKRRQEMHKEKIEMMGSLINVLKDLK